MRERILKIQIVGLLFLFPLSVLAQGSTFSCSATGGATLEGVVNKLVCLVNPLVGVLVSVTLLFFFYHLVRYIFTAGDSKGHEDSVKAIGWSLLGLFVIFGVWGIVKIVQTTLFGAS